MKDLSFEKRFTAVYQQYQSAPRAVREIMCLHAIYPALLPDIQPGDYFAGRALVMEWKGVGFTPDVTLFNLPHGMGYFYRASVFEDALQEKDLTADEEQQIRAMMAFWEQENTTAHVKSHFTDEIRRALPSDSFAGDVGVGFPLYRMTGAYENFGLLIREGIPGLRAMIAQHDQSDPFYQGLDGVVDILSEACAHYAAEARAMMDTAAPQYASRLHDMAEDLSFLLDHAPETMNQAIQLMWLYACLSGVMDYGRMDDDLAPYLARDLERGVTEEQAQEAICGLFRMMVARKTVYHGRVVIGGKGRKDERNADKFAMMAMEASARVHDIEPQLTLRFYKGQNPALFEKALDTIGAGCTYPMLYNDDVNIPCVMNAFQLDEKTAQQYVPFGCGEYIINHKGFGSPNGVINMLKALEVTIFDGVELVKHHEMGLKLGKLTDYQTFEDLLDAYKQQITYFVRQLADAEKIILDFTAHDAPFLMMSLLYDGCLEQGKSMLEGAIPYLGATLESYGNINAMDSLAAIRWAVYDKKLIPAQTLLDALENNFEGYEKERKILLDAPKYGNDDPYVDDLAREMHDFEAKLIRSQGARVGLHSFLMVVINNSANTYLGRWTGASADGRKALTFMANANNPTGGMDKNGMTAMLNSLLSFPAENHAGAVQNMRFGRDMFEHSRDKVASLLHTYFDLGGTQAMITVTGRKDLENALIHPEQYASLLVRVGGFSARFVELEKDVQQEVLSRTCY